MTGFIAAAETVDGAIKRLAAVVNGDVHANGIVVDASTRAAFQAADPAAAAAAIPAGLPAALLRAVLVVYNDLVSRRAAFNELQAGTGTWTIPSTAPEYARALDCLRGGASSASRYAADVATAEAVASSLPPITPADPASHAAGEVAIVVQWINGSNNGCGSCGGTVLQDLPTVTWYVAPSVSPVNPAQVADGSVGQASFSARYVPAKGWEVVIFAC